MSIKNEWKKLEARWKAYWAEFRRKYLEDPVVASTAGGASGLPNPSRASCWDGANAQVRHMNTLSPAFSDEQAADRFQWAADRGCNTVHLFVANQGDGEGAGYSIYGKEPKPGKPDAASVECMAGRLRKAHGKGLSVVLWLMADDSSKWNKTLLGNPVQYALDLKESGLLALADGVVLGLEMDEYMGSGQASALAAAVRSVYGGPVGTHHTSGKAPFAALGDFLCWQVKPGASAAQIKAETAKAAKFGKRVIMFEIARNPQRALCEAALDAGAAGVGNW